MEHLPATNEAELSRRAVVGLALAGVALASGLGAAPSMAAPRQVIAGTVARIKGEARATWSGLTRQLAAGTNVFTGDEIRTGKATRLEIRLNEGTTITLGDDTAMWIEGEETATAGGIVSIFEGIFLGATRAIADLSRDALTVKTPTAILGVRGTVVWGQQQPTQLSACMLSGTFVTVTTTDFATVLSTPLDGTDVIQGQPPTVPKRWGDARLAAARAAIAFE